MNKRFKKIYIEITNVCNLACSFCPKTVRPLCYMNEQTFARVLSEVRPYTDYIYLHLMGEPLVHPALGSLLALSADAGIRVNLTTNGVLIADAADTLLEASALRKVSFSLHSFEANDTRRSLDAYLEDIFAFAERAESLICELRLWNGDTAERGGVNARNDEILRRIEDRLGVTIGDMLEQKGGIKLRDRLYLGFAQIFDWPDPARGDLGTAFCYGLRDQIGVLADGTVVPCCLDSEGTAALGNLLTQPLAEILDSPRARAMYEGFSRREAVEPLCKSCGYARRF